MKLNEPLQAHTANFKKYFLFTPEWALRGSSGFIRFIGRQKEAQQGRMMAKTAVFMGQSMNQMNLNELHCFLRLKMLVLPSNKWGGKAVVRGQTTSRFIWFIKNSREVQGE
jgi:hypothetical protein